MKNIRKRQLEEWIAREVSGELESHESWRAMRAGEVSRELESSWRA